MTTSYRGEGLPRTAARGEGEDCHTHSPVLGEAHQKHPHFREESPESVPAPSKFTADRRKRILELLSVGPAAAPPPRCPASTTPRFSDGSGGAREASERSRWEQFYRDVLQAEAHPKIWALQIVQREMPDNPSLAWRSLERREPGFAPPVRDIAPPNHSGPVSIRVTSGGKSGPLPEPAIEDKVVEDAEGDDR
jgi:hypothetical protein